MEGSEKLMNSPVEIKQEPEPGLDQVSRLQLQLSGHLERGLGGKWPLPLAELIPMGGSLDAAIPRGAGGQQSPVQGRGWTAMGKTLQEPADSERGWTSRAGGRLSLRPRARKRKALAGSEGPEVRRCPVFWGCSLSWPGAPRPLPY